jgi:hypothetical protein
LPDRTPIRALPRVLVPACLLAAQVLGCGGGPSDSIRVRIRTDRVPEVEFTRVVTRVREPARVEQQGTHGADPGIDYVEGVRVARLTELPGQELLLNVELRDGDDAPIAARPVRVDPAVQDEVTVLLARSCAGMQCPPPGGDSARTACHGGRCVVPGCSEERPELCGTPACQQPGDCPAPAECAERRCILGACLGEAKPGACSSDQWCKPEQGCRTRPGGGPARCDDGIANGDETDVDCGGPDCSPCANGSSCMRARDCMTRMCDGQTGTCRFAHSCSELLEAGNGQDGRYSIDPDGSAEDLAPFEVRCDMTTAGGGWTAITPRIAREELNGALVSTTAAEQEGFDADGRPCTRDGTGGHTYHYTFDFPAGFAEFRLEGYVARANAAETAGADLSGASFMQSSWDSAAEGDHGDISFGSAFEQGPRTSFAAELDSDVDCSQCTVQWPRGETTFELATPDTAFRIGWGEAGSEAEGWCPWWQGAILLR